MFWFVITIQKLLLLTIFLIIVLILFYCDNWFTNLQIFFYNKPWITLSERLCGSGLCQDQSGSIKKNSRIFHRRSLKLTRARWHFKERLSYENDPIAYTILQVRTCYDMVIFFRMEDFTHLKSTDCEIYGILRDSHLLVLT